MYLQPASLIFLSDKKVPVAGTRRASYFGWENRYLRPARPLRLIFLFDKQVPVAGTRRALYFEWKNRYMQSTKHQVHVAPYVMIYKVLFCMK